MANDPGNRSLCVLVAGPHTAGKTTYLEHLLLRRALVDRLGRVEDGTSHLDTEPEEVRHGFSLALAVATVPTAEGTLFLLDCPGEADLVAEQVGARSIADLALIFAAADAEPARATLEAFAWARTMGVPALLALSRLDHPNARFEEALERSAQVLGTAVLPLALPDGAGEGLSGLVDLVTFERHGPGHTRARAGDAARQAAASSTATSNARRSPMRISAARSARSQHTDRSWPCPCARRWTSGSTSWPRRSGEWHPGVWRPRA
jgi:translation elongation factor EF-G